jgi:oleate hydratase
MRIWWVAASGPWPHVVFTVEYLLRAAQMAVYQLLGIDRKAPLVSPYAKSLHAQVEALIRAFK